MRIPRHYQKHPKPEYVVGWSGKVWWFGVNKNHRWVHVSEHATQKEAESAREKYLESESKI